MDEITKLKNKINSLELGLKNTILFQTKFEFINYFKNLEYIPNDIKKIKTILYNLDENIAFRYSTNEIRKKVYDVLKMNKEIKKLNIGEIYKLYFYFYDVIENKNDLEEVLLRYSRDLKKVNYDTFVEFIFNENKELYNKWRFPTEIDGDYKLFNDIINQISDRENLEKFSKIILTLGKYIEFENIPEEMRELFARECLNKIPKNILSFMKSNNLNLVKIEKLSKNIFIHLDRDVIVISLDKNEEFLGIDLITINRYKRIIEGEVNRFRTEEFLETLADKLQKADYEINKVILHKNKIKWTLILLGILGTIGYLGIILSKKIQIG